MGWAFKMAGKHGGLDLPLPPSFVTVSIPFLTNHRRDPHNYVGTVVKAIVDGLVAMGAWKDDTAEYVTVKEPVLYKGDTVTVWIEEKNGNNQPTEVN
jgi:hypothetical protein